jgi:hypothetical protein
MPANPRSLEPPFYDPVLSEHKDGQQFSHAWTDYQQRVADKLQVLDQGVVDGSDAEAGDVGEYLSASGSVGMPANAVTTVATLTLTPGDWDVSGGVTFAITTAASSRYGVGIDGVLSTEMVATIPTGSGTWRLAAAPVRRNVSVGTAVTLSALAGFSSGSVAASGTLSARRMR